jgi:hypothetical protein
MDFFPPSLKRRELALMALPDYPYNLYGNDPDPFQIQYHKGPWPEHLCHLITIAPRRMSCVYGASLLCGQALLLSVCKKLLIKIPDGPG